MDQDEEIRLHLNRDSKSIVEHIKSLDIIRGLAVLLVLSWHCFGDLIVTNAFIGAGVVKKLLSLGWSGVMLFFVLSGYLITNGILTERAKNLFGLMPYFTKRFFRIVPAFSILLLSYVLILKLFPDFSIRNQWLFGNPMPLWSYITFTQNIAMALKGGYGARFLSPTWSLAVEAQFYVLLPILLLLLKYSKNFSIPLFMILIGTVSRIAVPGWADVVLPTSALDSLGGGALIAFAQHNKNIWNLLKKSKKAIASSGVVFLLGLFALLFVPNTFWKFNHLWLAATFSWLVLVCVINPFPKTIKKVSFKPLQILGKISYSVYLFHYPILGGVFLFFGITTPAIDCFSKGLISLLAIFISFFVGNLNYYCIEAPMLRIGRKVSKTLQYVTRQ